MAKHTRNDVPSASKQELMYDHWLKKRLKMVNLTANQKLSQYPCSGILVAQKHTVCSTVDVKGQ
jgi:hypothetical protein